MTHKRNKWLQILAQEDFTPKLLWSENADFKYSVNNEGEDFNKKQEIEEQEIGDQRHYDLFTLWKTQIYWFAGFPADI